MEPAGLMIDGFGPLPIVRPTTVAELGEVVRRAAADGQAIYPFGGQTQLDLGNPPTKRGIAVDMRGLDQVIDFPARDMTITVQAGITIARLQFLVAPHNLHLPIDVPDPEWATLGGILATNISGPRRLSYGTLRDYVIGISAVNDLGNEFKAGGRVVKNVAGYDLCKLLVGSLGTLGVITQVTLKLRPLPEEISLISLGAEAGELESLLDKIHASNTRPVCVELLNRRAAKVIFGAMPSPESPWTLLVGYEGNLDAVRWQVQRLVKELGSEHAIAVRMGPSAEPLWQSLVSWTANSNRLAWTALMQPTQVVSPDGTGKLAPWLFLKASMQPTRVIANILAAPDEFNLMVQAHAANGVVSLCWTNVPEEKVLTIVTNFRALSVPGTSVIHWCPAVWKNSLPVWDPPPEGMQLMKSVKKQFDPKGLFNPGRFVGGI